MAVSRHLFKTWNGEWDFAKDGGAISTITLRSNDGPIPSASIIEGGLIEVATILTSGGAGTAAMQVEAPNDLQAATPVERAPWSTTGRTSMTRAFASPVKCTTDRSPAIVFAASAITAGKCRLILVYR